MNTSTSACQRRPYFGFIILSLVLVLFLFDKTVGYALSPGKHLFKPRQKLLMTSEKQGTTKKGFGSQIPKPKVVTPASGSKHNLEKFLMMYTCKLCTGRNAQMVRLECYGFCYYRLFIGSGCLGRHNDGVLSITVSLLHRTQSHHSSPASVPLPPSLSVSLIIIQVSKVAYNYGMVVSFCKHCQVKHLIADNEGKMDFPKEYGKRIEDYLRDQGETIQRLSITSQV